MQFNNRWFGEAFATPAYPLDSREKTNFEALGGPRSWMGDSSFGADADTAAADPVVAEGGTRKSTVPPEIRPEGVRAPQVSSLRSQYAIGLLGICLVFAPMRLGCQHYDGAEQIYYSNGSEHDHTGEGTCPTHYD